MRGIKGKVEVQRNVIHSVFRSMFVNNSDGSAIEAVCVVDSLQTLAYNAVNENVRSDAVIGARAGSRFSLIEVVLTFSKEAIAGIKASSSWREAVVGESLVPFTHVMSSISSFLQALG